MLWQSYTCPVIFFFFPLCSVVAAPVDRAILLHQRKRAQPADLWLRRINTSQAHVFANAQLVQLRAQCPRCPHLAHFVLSIRDERLHIFGLAVLNRPRGPNFD